MYIPTGIPSAQIQGEHLLLPGYSEDHPTLEIFSYSVMKNRNPNMINNLGLGHLAFEVDDVRETLKEVLNCKAGTGRMEQRLAKVRRRSNQCV